MAPKKFDRCWHKLPKELQLRVWVLSMTPRIIRANYESFITLRDEYQTIYRLSGGPVPKVLHICRESRTEALKHYTPVRRRAPVSDKKKVQPGRGPRIYVNFDTDTLYFVSYPAAPGFLSWIRRIPREEKDVKNKSYVKGKGVESKDVGKNIKPLKTVKHIAFPADRVLEKNKLPMRWDVWYGLVVDLPELKTITIAMDKGEFTKRSTPHLYQLVELPKLGTKKSKKCPVKSNGQPAGTKSVPALCVPVQTAPAQADATPAGNTQTDIDNTHPTPINPAPPGIASILQWSNSRDRVEMDGLLVGFWNNSSKCVVGEHAVDYGAKFRKWRETEQGKTWVPPTFEMRQVKMNPKAHVKGW